MLNDTSTRMARNSTRQYDSKICCCEEFNCWYLNSTSASISLHGHGSGGYGEEVLPPLPGLALLALDDGAAEEEEADGEAEDDPAGADAAVEPEPATLAAVEEE